MSGQSAPGAPQGFSAELKGASLFDLIQFECASRGRKVVRVTSEGKSALMYFCDGRIVHAVAGRTTGEAAVRELLTWGKGTFARFDHVEGAWPLLETIGASAESVLLRAAQALDEERGKVVALPVREGDGDDIELALRLSGDGDLLERQGQLPEAESDGYCDAVAYAAQLTDLVGELMGQGPFQSVELTFRQGRSLMARLPDGHLVAIKAGPRGTLDGLRQRLGLDR